MGKIDVIYDVQVHEGPDLVALEREISVNEVPTGEDRVDFTPLEARKTDERLIFGVMPSRTFCHAAVGRRERVRVHLHSIHAGSSARLRLEPDPELLEAHGFRRVRAE